MEKELLNIIIGQRIKVLRKAKGLSQSDLARACFKDRQHVEKIENGKTNPTLFTIHELAQAIGVSLSEFFDFKFDENKEVYQETPSFSNNKLEKE